MKKNQLQQQFTFQWQKISMEWRAQHFPFVYAPFFMSFTENKISMLPSVRFLSACIQRIHNGCCVLFASCAMHIQQSFKVSRGNCTNKNNKC